MISLSIIVPCLNEEENIEATLLTLVAALNGRIKDYEILVFNDASTDGTQAKIESLSKKIPQLRPIQLSQHCGVGPIFMKGISLAQKSHLTIFGGDNEIPQTSIEAILDAAGSAEVIFTFIHNPEVRTWYRRLLSRSFTVLMNVASGNRLRYYNGPAIYSIDTLRKLNITYTGFGFLAEIAVRLLQQKYTDRQITFELRPRRGPSRMLTPLSLMEALHSLWRARSA